MPRVLQRLRYQMRTLGLPHHIGLSSQLVSSLHTYLEAKLIPLEPVNTDPVLSPKKQRSSAQAKPENPEKPVPKPRSRPRLNITRNAAPELAPLPMPEPVPTADIILESLPPKTPAVEAAFSPPS